MSSLSYLSGYGSDSEDSDTQKSLDSKRNKLPIPDLSKVRVVGLELHVDDSQLHGGRKRSFPHVRGNWATFVYLIYPADDGIYQLIHKIREVCTQSITWNNCDDLHISLSKTVVLNYHCISPFNTSLQKALVSTESFCLRFGAAKVLCNEDNSRTFIVLEVDHFSYKYLLSITKKVDEVLSDFNLATFYDDPSFHMSILWTNGNKKQEIMSILENRPDIVINETGNSLKSITIDKVHCKSGNKYFQYILE